MKPVTQLTRKDIEKLLKEKPGTNNRAVSATENEVQEMHKHLGGIYPGRVQISFAEKICLRNKEH